MQLFRSSELLVLGVASRSSRMPVDAWPISRLEACFTGELIWLSVPGSRPGAHLDLPIRVHLQILLYPLSSTLSPLSHSYQITGSFDMSTQKKVLSCAVPPAIAWRSIVKRSILAWLGFSRVLCI